MFEKFKSLPIPFSKIVIHTFLAFHTHIPGFQERAFPCLFCLKLHDFTQFKPNILWRSTPDPPPPQNCDSTNTFYNTKQSCQMSFGREKTPG